MVKGGYRGKGINLGDNRVGNFLALKNLLPMNFFKYAIIVKLKMYTTDKNLAEICLKAIKDTFF